MEQMSAQAVLCLHGFSGGPFEIEPLAKVLEYRGYQCYIPTLPGHEAQLLNLSESTWEDWLQFAFQVVEDILITERSLHVVGFSMGALLASAVANRYPVERLVLLNPAYFYISPYHFASQLIKQVIHKDFRRFTKMGRVPVSATVQFMKCVHALKSEYSSLSIPTQIVQGLKDEIILPYSAKWIARRIQGSCELHTLAHSHHLLTYGHDKELLFKKVTAFLDHSMRDKEQGYV